MKSRSVLAGLYVRDSESDTVLLVVWQPEDQDGGRIIPHLSTQLSPANSLWSSSEI